MNYIRDYSMMVAFFGFFSMAWYGWAQEDPPKNWKKYLFVGTGLAAILFLTGIYFSVQNWQEATTLSNTTSLNYYYIFLVLEFGIAGIGAFVMYRKNLETYIAPWVCFIVGVHFFGLRYVFDDFVLHILGILLAIISGLTLILAKKFKIRHSAITGVCAGTTLILFALLNLYRLF